MDDPQKVETPTPEELNAEKEIEKAVSDDEIRSKIAEEIGLDPEVDSELLDKLVIKDKATREKLSGAIKQKIKYRTQLEEKSKSTDKDKKPESDKEKAKISDPEEVAKLVDQKVSERLEARDLKELALPEAIENEVKKIATLNGVSVREAAKDPYIVFKIEEFKRQEILNSASPTRGNKGQSFKVTYDPSKPLDPANFKLDTPEGREEWNKAKKAREEYEKTHS